MFRLLPLMLITVMMAGSLTPSTVVAMGAPANTTTGSNTDCAQWVAGTQQNVSIDAGNTVVMEGPACNTLRDVKVTLQCGPGSTVVLRGWGMDGGFIAIAGIGGSLTPLPAAVDNVTIAIHRSRIWALDGPAVGIDVHSDSNGAPLNITVTGLRLTARSSDLRSTGNTSATVLGVTGASTSTSRGAVVTVVGLEVVMVNTTAKATATGVVAGRYRSRRREA